MKRTHVGLLGIATLVCSFVVVTAASPTRKNCADDQDGTCTLDVDRIEGNTGSFLPGWVEASEFFGKTAVYAGSSDQTVLNGNGLYASVSDVTNSYADTLTVGSIGVHTVNATYLNGAFKSFRIDHPGDPGNRVLNHWSVESSEMKNIYDGVATLDGNGAALVTMPRWFDALNVDFRYQLTAIGAPAANLHVAEEIVHRQFKIAGGIPHLKVSWQVTGVRHDASARNNRVPIEEDKAPQDRGKYLDPAAFGQPLAMGLMHNPRPAPPPKRQPVPTAK